MNMKRPRSILRWLFFVDFDAYLAYRRAMQGCDRAGVREQNWYDPFGEPKP
jgi:hypothetical protein